MQNIDNSNERIPAIVWWVMGAIIASWLVLWGWWFSGIEPCDLFVFTNRTNPSWWRVVAYMMISAGLWGYWTWWNIPIDDADDFREEPQQHHAHERRQARGENVEEPFLKGFTVWGLLLIVTLVTWAGFLLLKMPTLTIAVPILLTIVTVSEAPFLKRGEAKVEHKDLEVPWEQPRYQAKQRADASDTPEQTDWGKLAILAVFAIVTPTTFFAAVLAIMSKIGWWIIPLIFAIVLFFTGVAMWMRIMERRLKRIAVTIVVILGIATTAILFFKGREVIPPLAHKVQTALAVKKAVQSIEAEEIAGTATPVPTTTGTPTPTPAARATQVAGIKAAEAELGTMVETVKGNTSRVIEAVEKLETEKSQKPEHGVLGTWGTMVNDRGGFTRASQQVSAWFSEGVTATNESGAQVWVPMPFPQRVIEHSTAGNLSSKDAGHLNLAGSDLVSAQEALTQFVRHLSTHTKDAGEIQDTAWIATANSLKDGYNGAVNSFNQHASNLGLQGRLLLLPGDIVDRVVSCSKGTPIEVTPTPDVAATAAALTREAPPTKAPEPTPIPTNTPVPTATPTATPTTSGSFPTVNIQTPTPTVAMPTSIDVMQWGSPTATVGPGTPTPEPDYCTPAPPTGN